MTKTQKEIKYRWDRWTSRASCCTTAQFADADRGYVRHCGPVAITNVILTLRGEKSKERADTVFHTCAVTGMEMLSYWNTDLFGKFGGTSNLLTIPYLRACLFRTGTRGVRIGGIHKFLPGRAAQSLERGDLLYLILRRHPKYGDHHALCCGGYYSDRLYLLVEDGWQPRLQAIEARELCGSWYFTIEQEA